jgi:hypothetical protein
MAENNDECRVGKNHAINLLIVTSNPHHGTFKQQIGAYSGVVKDKASA